MLTRDYSKWMTEEIHSKLLNDFFKSSAINVDTSRNCEMKFSNGVMTFGMMAALTVCPTFTIHEMAHLVEIDDERMTLRGWGLKVPQIYIGGRMCLEPVTCQDVERETRVAALQYNVQKHLGINENPRQVVSSFVHLPGFCYSPYYKGIYWNNPKSHKTNDSSRIKYISGEIKRLADTPEYSLDYFMVEWKRKNELLWKIFEKEHDPSVSVSTHSKL